MPWLFGRVLEKAERMSYIGIHARWFKSEIPLDNLTRLIEELHVDDISDIRFRKY